MRPRSLDEFLKRAHVPFTAFQHPAGFSAQQVAALSHVPGRSWAKTVVCFADQDPILAIVPANVMVDLERLRVLAQAVTLRLAGEQELGVLFPDCELGAISPFTLAGQWRLKIFVDHDLVGEPEMVFCAGTYTEAIRMHYEDFAELTRPTVGPIGQRQAGQPKPARSS